MNIYKEEQKLKEKCDDSDLASFLSNFKDYLFKKYYLTNKKLERYKLRFIADRNKIHIIRDNYVVGWISGIISENKLCGYSSGMFDVTTKKNCKSYKSIIKHLDKYLIKVQEVDKE